MKKLILILPLTIGLAACDTPQERGAGTGALAGAAIGAAISSDDDRVKGALIGGATGAIAGGMIGKANSPGDCVYQDAYGRRYVADCPR